MKKFLAGSAIASIFTTNGELIAISNTQINDTINLSVESQEVRSGYGNALDYIYYHSTKMEGQLEDAQFNLDYIKHNIGAKEDKVATLYKSANVTIKATGNTINGEMLDEKGNVWAYHKDKAYTFPAIYANGVITFDNPYTELNDENVCIKYLAQESGDYVRNLTISSNFVPDIVTIVLEAQLFASESGAGDSSRIGTVMFKIPKAQLTGTQEISLSSSGVASTPLSYMALKADDATANACASASGVYGYITEILDGTGANWYDGVQYLAIEAVLDTLTVTPGKTYVNTYAVSEQDSFIIRPRNRITYGVKSTGDTLVNWIRTDADDDATKISVEGKIGEDIAAGDLIYVALGEWRNTAPEGQPAVWEFRANSNVGQDVATIAIAE